MALAQYVKEPNIHITKRMFAPKKHVQDVMSWYKEAKKCIPELPTLVVPPPLHSLVIEKYYTKDQWFLPHEPDITPAYIKFTLMNGIGERAHLVIDRKAPSIG